MNSVYFNIWPELSEIIKSVKTNYYLMILIAFLLFIWILIWSYRLVILIKKYQKLTALKAQLEKEFKMWMLNEIYKKKWNEQTQAIMNFLENFIIWTKYSSIEEILEILNLEKNEILEISNHIYKWQSIDYDLNMKLINNFKEILDKN